MMMRRDLRLDGLVLRFQIERRLSLDPRGCRAADHGDAAADTRREIRCGGERCAQELERCRATRAVSATSRLQGGMRVLARLFDVRLARARPRRDVASAACCASTSAARNVR